MGDKHCKYQVNTALLQMKNNYLVEVEGKHNYILQLESYSPMLLASQELCAAVVLYLVERSKFV